ncbi:TIGR00266 family protein [Haloarcula nitratireducens]|uniref:TIGR00266 family protein n=1 Tax=Haloarcula nitratireducens TaxID=2487749 RepID=A0AAW4P8N0_9EURY|nr:TIGR00266 family protein [Halomicroarcula nitratireducens]MBX0294123.1 TIGR00266 family protein [Halomicroarcula nitratireducens]
MDFEFTQQPAYTLVKVTLESGDSIQAEPGAMVSMSDTVAIATSKSNDGILSSAKSMLGGESLVANTFTAEGGRGEVTLAPPTPGDVHHHEMDDGTLYAVDGSYLASTPDVEIESEFGGLKSMLSGVGVTPLALKGSGDVFVEAFGGLETVELAEGERYTIDNDHVVAWEGTTDFDARRIGGLKSTLLSGEGIVMDFTGPGKVWYQTRGMDAFTSAIAADIASGGRDDNDDGIGVEDLF